MASKAEGIYVRGAIQMILRKYGVLHSPYKEYLTKSRWSRKWIGIVQGPSRMTMYLNKEAKDRLLEEEWFSWIKEYEYTRWSPAYIQAMNKLKEMALKTGELDDLGYDIAFNPAKYLGWTRGEGGSQ